MEAQIQVFQHEMFGSLRILRKDAQGEPWFVAKDVCKCLELTDASKTISLLDDDEKGTNTVRTLGGEQQMLVISEPGLYSLILRSRKPEAKAFKRWVTHDILPSIRKTGGYLATKPDDTPETILARAVLIAQDTIKRVEAERDEAVRTKAWIGSRREATAMATAASATRRAKALEAQLGLAGDYLAVKGIKWLPEIFDLTKGGTYSQIGKYLKRLSLTENYMVKAAPDSLHESVGLYHKDIIALFRKQLEDIPSLMRKYRHADASHAA
ncbi:Bro-N domain-containing protein [Bilophila wadsworthia]|uniref:BRO-N domain-containing protein n=1 Tax=Bilophila wadsworthia TaxID=35833 RepID=UPI003AB2482D